MRSGWPPGRSTCAPAPTGCWPAWCKSLVLRRRTTANFSPTCGHAALSLDGRSIAHCLAQARRKFDELAARRLGPLARCVAGWRGCRRSRLARARAGSCRLDGFAQRRVDQRVGHPQRGALHLAVTRAPDVLQDHIGLDAVDDRQSPVQPRQQGRAQLRRQRR